MAVETIKIKRRMSGAAGAPSALKSGEFAWNTSDQTLYLGDGDDGSGNATSIKAVAGNGAMVDKTTAQTVAGVKTFSSSPIIPTPSANDNSTKAASTAYVDTGLALKANLASPALTGLPTAPTQASGDNSTKLATTAYVDGQKGVASGIASLDGSGKVPTSQLPSSVVGAMAYQGTWNASTNSPALASGVGTKGYYYKVSVTGTTSIDSVAQWNAGDLISFDGTVWDKIDGLASEVLSVAGRTGAVTLAVADVSGAAPLVSPGLTGLPTAPTATAGDNSTLIATTAFVAAALAVIDGGTF